MYMYICCLPSTPIQTCSSRSTRILSLHVFILRFKSLTTKNQSELPFAKPRSLLFFRCRPPGLILGIDSVHARLNDHLNSRSPNIPAFYLNRNYSSSIDIALPCTMTLPASESQMPDFGDIHHATMGCISDFEACLSIKPLMKEGWAESRLADLNLWASGVGALARPDMSLDRRLQFQPKPRLVLINLLLTLREFISSCRMYDLSDTHGDKESTSNRAKSEGAPVSPTESTAELTLGDDSDPTPSSASWFTALVSSRPESASDTSTDSNVGDELDDPHSEVTLKEVMKDIDDILDQLIMLGFAIRKSGTVARLRKADSSFKPSENEDLRKHLEFILLNSVARRQKNKEDDMESTAKERIQEVTPEQRRLILANLRRRHRFRYARRHQQKLDQLTAYPPVAKTKPFVHTPEEHQEMTPGLNRSPASNDGKSPPTEGFPSTTPSTAPPQDLQAPEMSATTPSVAEGDILQIAMPTAAAASRVSVSVATMNYPSPPPISQKVRGFKCPCCYQTLPEMYKNWSRWRYVSVQPHPR